MSETIVAGLIGAAVTGFCGISLFLVKKLTNCMCPGKCVFDCRGGSIKENKAVRTLNVKYETPDNSAGHGRRSGTTWKMSVPPDNSTKAVLVYQEFRLRPEKGHHFLRVNLSDMTHDQSVYLFVRRFTGSSNEWIFAENGEGRLEAFEGVNTIYKRSLIGENEVNKEQVGLMVVGNNSEVVKCTVEEAYYGEIPLSICHSCCNGIHCMYRCFDKKEEVEEKKNEV